MWHVKSVPVLLILFQEGKAFHLETVSTSNSACAGSEGIPETTPNVTCDTGSVIAVNQIVVGAKPTADNCSDATAYITNPSCCVKSDLDCTFSFEITQDNNYYEFNGRNSDTAGVQIVATADQCSPSTTYPLITNFMFMEYSCIQETGIYSICSNVNVSGVSVFVWNDGFPGVIPSTVSECDCSVQANDTNASILVQTIQRVLTGNTNEPCGQTLLLFDDGNNVIYNWTCDHNIYNTENVTVTSSYMVLRLQNDRTEHGGNFWLSFEATDPSVSLALSCPAHTVVTSTGQTLASEATGSTSTSANTSTPSPSVYNGDSEAFVIAVSILSSLLALTIIVNIIVIVVVRRKRVKCCGAPEAGDRGLNTINRQWKVDIATENHKDLNTKENNSDTFQKRDKNKTRKRTDSADDANKVMILSQTPCLLFDDKGSNTDRQEPHRVEKATQVDAQLFVEQSGKPHINKHLTKATVVSTSVKKKKKNTKLTKKRIQELFSNTNVQNRKIKLQTSHSAKSMTLEHIESQDKSKITNTDDRNANDEKCKMPHTEVLNDDVKYPENTPDMVVPNGMQTPSDISEDALVHVSDRHAIMFSKVCMSFFKQEFSANQLNKIRAKSADVKKRGRKRKIEESNLNSK